jgi:Undecaprenyl-phosphate glucose phosphotransferase
LADLATIVGSGAIVYFVYVHNQGFNLRYATTILFAALLATTLFHWFKVYEQDYVLSKRFRVGRLLAAWATAFAVLLLLAFALKITNIYSRVWAMAWFASCSVFLLCVRMLLDGLVHRWAQEGRFADRTVIVGAGEQGQRLAEHLREFGDIHTQIMGFIDDRKTRVPMENNGLAILGNVEHLISLIRDSRVDQVFLALPWSAERRLRELVDRIAVTPVRICLAPEAVSFGFPKRSFIQVGHLPVLQVFERPISGWDLVVKAVEDRVLSTVALVFLAPLLAVIALAIKLDSRGPVFFKQPRYGFNNRLFEVWKFRTMYIGRNDAGGAVQAKRGDDRVTRVGNFLRKTSLDELPQLVNVFLGDMSLVGPRPHAISTKAAGVPLAEAVERYAARHSVKPGITGWAQVNGWRGETDTLEKIQKRVEHDFYYIEHWSLWLDLRILLMTTYVIFKDDNAY